MNKTPKHDPLPWHVSGDDNNWWVAPEGWDERVEREHYLGGAVCEMDNWNGTDHWHDAERAEANARLIVQAVNSLPDYQEALSALRVLNEETILAGFPGGDCCDRVKAMRANVLSDLSRLRAARDQQPKRSNS